MHDVPSTVNINRFPLPLLLRTRKKINIIRQCLLDLEPKRERKRRRNTTQPPTTVTLFSFFSRAGASWCSPIFIQRAVLDVCQCIASLLFLLLFLFFLRFFFSAALLCTHNSFIEANARLSFSFSFSSSSSFRE